MCGMYGHGFYWKTETKDEYTIVFDFEINSHSRIKEYRPIPEEAIKIGFNPVGGTATTNDLLPLPPQVAERIEILFNTYFPNTETIAEWINNNYGKQDDQAEWDLPLLQMLGDDGAGLLSAIYFEKQIKYCEGQIKYFEWQIKYFEWRIKDCTGTLTKMEIDKFIPYFLSHPNSFWAQRCEKREIEYKSFVIA